MSHESSGPRPTDEGPEVRQDAGASLPDTTKRRSRLRQAVMIVACLLVAYLVVAYVVLPLGWVRYAHRHPALDDIPRITRTIDDIPGDPLNVALIGTETELKKIMLAAKWYPADPLTLKSCLEMADAAVLKRPYDDAPVSKLYFEGRKEDLAFEQPVGDSPRHRHHVRLWRTDKVGEGGRPIWVGSAVYDERVGLSRKTGQITHVTADDIDAERDYLFRDLQATGDLSEVFFVDDFHTVHSGRNGGGDPWFTDGRLEVGVIAPAAQP
jgi:LssY C-terminus